MFASDFFVGICGILTHIMKTREVISYPEGAYGVGLYHFNNKNLDPAFLKPGEKVELLGPDGMITTVFFHCVAEGRIIFHDTPPQVESTSS